MTIPYKERVMPFLDEISDRARQIGSVNTVVRRDGKLFGYNTDFAGMQAMLRHTGLTLTGKKVMILGTGGTSKTARAVAAAEGASEITLVSRSGREGAVTYETAIRENGKTQILINTTPCGMYPALEGFPIDPALFPALEGAQDVIYHPLRTDFVQMAQARSLPADGGLYMLAAQAVYASALFFGVPARPEEIERVYRAVLSEKRNLVLIGMPSCGKTAVGKCLAERLRMPLTDTDEMLLPRLGMSIADYFARFGEAAFRQAEREAVKECAMRSGCVIAVGGGAVLDPENVRALRRNGLLLFLDRSPDQLIPTADRPLSSNREMLRKRYEERYPLYCAAADFRIDGNGSVEETAERIEEVLKR